MIVPSNFAGLVARRLLGSGHLGATAAGGRGIVNVNFVTPLRLAELLAPEPAGDQPERRRLTNPVLGAAVRLALADEPGPFRDVRDHHATEVALAGLYGELSHVSDESLDVLRATGSKARAAVALHRGIEPMRSPLGPIWPARAARSATSSGTCHSRWSPRSSA